jgi:WD40 repeat protein
VLSYEYSSWELLRRFVRRNPLLSLVSALALVVLLAASVVVHRAQLEALDALADALQGRALDAEQDARCADAAVYYAASRLRQDSSGARWGEKLSRTLAPVPVLSLPAKGLVRAALSGDGARIATAGEGTIQIWDAKTGAMLSSEKSEGAVAALAYSGQSLAVARGNMVSIGGRELSTGSEVHTFALSHDGALLAAAGTDGGFRLFRASDGARLFAVAGARVAGLAFGDDDRHVYSSGWDGALRETDLSGKETMKVELAGSRLWGIAVKGRRVAVGNRSGVLRYWNEGLSAQPLVYAEASPGLAAVAFSPDGGILAAAGRGGRVHLRDAASGRLLVTFEGPPHPSRRSRSASG